MERIVRFILIFLSGLSCHFTFARQIEAGKKYLSISAALEQSKDGDTIVVKAGYYHEKNLIIRKQIVLISYENANLDGDHNTEIITVVADNVTIAGFCLANTGRSGTTDFAAVRIHEHRNCRVINNRIENAFFGIYAERSNQIEIKNNQLTALTHGAEEGGNGIHGWKCDTLTITGNQIQGHRDGIYFEFVTNSKILNNFSHNNQRYGLHFMFSHNNLYRDNRFVKNGSGVAVMYSKNVHMYHNKFEQNTGNANYGLLLKDMDDSKIEYNDFYNNTAAVYFEGSSRLTLHANNFRSNGWALRIQASCENVKIDSNNFILNSFDISTNGSLVLNSFNHNYWDKYEGYDLKKDGFGDVPYQPVSLYSVVSERNPASLLLMHSFLQGLMDRAEKMIPSITPVDLKDNAPLMKPLPL